MGIFDFLFRRKAEPAPAPVPADNTPIPGLAPRVSNERGMRATPEAAQRYLYNRMWVDPDVRQAILDVREMDRSDGRVKKIHRVTSRAAAKGGIMLRAVGEAKRLTQEWDLFVRRLQLDRRDRLQSYVRTLMMQGNLAMQWLVDLESGNLADCACMPAETIRPNVSPSGRFIDPQLAYEQLDLAFGSMRVIAQFPLWQLTLGRLEPDNYDDWGALGRPYLDASRRVWKQLRLTEDDLVLRRHMRAPLRMHHVLEGASPEELKTYQLEVEQNQGQGNFKDYYTNKKGAVTAVQGDANLDHIADVAHLLDSFYAGSPAPKGLFGYVGDLSRDILLDLKEDYFDELDALQDNTSFVLEVGFRLHLLLRGLNPNAYDFRVQFRERRTDTPNQRADLALKYQALGVPAELFWDAAGLDVHEVQEALERQRLEGDPYPDPELAGGEMEGEAAGFGRQPARKPKVSVTPGNAPKGESATSITTRS